MQPTLLIPSVAEVKSLIDHRLNEYCEVRIKAAGQVNEHYATLWKAINSLLSAGGKRFRPYMLVATFSAYATEEAEIESILPAALAQELVHQAMLIHDDIIDRDTTRYGIANISGQYYETYAPYIKSANERAHMSLSTALLAGDALLSDSYQFLSKVKASPEQLRQATSILSNGVFEVIGGELLDTQTSFLNDPSVTAQTIARFKTASYSFMSPISMGAVFAGASAKEVQLLRQFSEYLGIGYQLRDDLLGMFGEASETGKSTSTDITEGKRTFLIEQFELLATETQKQLFAQTFHNPTASEAAIATAKELLIESEAKRSVEAAIETLQAKAEHIISLLSISDEAKQVFYELVQQCICRDK